jgi:hypothetical protein
MGRIVIFLGNFFRSVQGWIILIFTTLPTIATLVAGYLEGINWAARILIAMTVLLVGAALAYYCIRLLEVVSFFSETRKDQKRIAKELGDYIESGIGQYIDLPTAAAIWSGSREEGNAKRHLCFRQLKGHTNNGRIRNAKNLSEKGKAYIKTSIPLDELVKFFIKQGIIKETDIAISSGS